MNLYDKLIVLKTIRHKMCELDMIRHKVREPDPARTGQPGMACQLAKYLVD